MAKNEPVSIGTSSGNTKQRSIRVPDARWERALAHAKSNGESLASKINEFLEVYAPAQAPKRKRG